MNLNEIIQQIMQLKHVEVCCFIVLALIVVIYKQHKKSKQKSLFKRIKLM